MSKQSEAKTAQGYRDTPRNCGNCAHRQFTIAIRGYYAEENARSLANGDKPYYTDIDVYGEEGASKCGIGLFVVKKTATCSLHALKEPT